MSKSKKKFTGVESVKASSSEDIESHKKIRPDKGYIFEIQKMSTEDGPGLRTTVFFKGCPLHCVWCHNPESISLTPSIQWFSVKCIGCGTCVEECPTHSLTLDENGITINRESCTSCGKCAEVCPSTSMRKLGEYYTLDELMDEILKDQVYYLKSGGGVTASGGEAALQSDFVLKFFTRLKEFGIHTALDLCGSLPWEFYEKLLPVTDLFLYDIKEFDDDKHKKFTQQSNKRILENLKKLVSINREIKEHKRKGTPFSIWIRTPLIPTMTATEDNIRNIGNFIVNELNNEIDRWDLLAFNNLAKSKYERMDLPYLCDDLELLTKEQMEEFLQIAKAKGVNNVYWSGLTKSPSLNGEQDEEKQAGDKIDKINKNQANSENRNGKDSNENQNDTTNKVRIPKSGCSLGSKIV